MEDDDGDDDDGDGDDGDGDDGDGDDDDDDDDDGNNKGVDVEKTWHLCVAVDPRTPQTHVFHRQTPATTQN
jgi:hypothetical protein